MARGLVCTTVACGDGSAPGTPSEAPGSGGSADDAGVRAAGGSSPGASGASSMLLTEYWEAALRQACFRIIHCPVANGDQLGARVQLENVERCQQHYLELQARSRGGADLTAAIESGRVLFDAERAGSCIPPEDCSASTPLAQACAGVFEGTLPEGALCRRDEECQGNSYCRAETGPCDGRCTPRRPVGAECSDAADCDPGEGRAICDPATVPGVCSIFTVTAQALEGEPCGYLSEDHYEYCRGDFWCNSAGTDVGVCQRAIALGDPCRVGDDPCVGLGFCGADDSNDTCQPVTLTREAGGPCDGPSGISPTMCDPLANLVCIDGTCQHTDGLEGSACNSSDVGDAQCHAGLYCSSETEPASCAPLQAPGTECHSSGVCSETCDFVNSVCTEQYCAARGVTAVAN